MGDAARPARRRSAVAALALLLTASGCSAVRGPTTRLTATSGFDGLNTHDAYVGSLYNAGIASLAVDGDDEVRLVSVEARGAGPGVGVLPVSLVRLGSGQVQIGAAVGDPEMRYPGTKLVGAAGVRLTSADNGYWYVLLQAKPTQLGSQQVTGVRVRYRVGGRTKTLDIGFDWRIHVGSHGRDPRADEPPVR